MSDMTPAAEYCDADLVELALQVYARSMAYPDSRPMHERWVECRKELIERFAHLRSCLSEERTKLAHEETMCALAREDSKRFADYAELQTQALRDIVAICRTTSMHVSQKEQVWQVGQLALAALAKIPTPSVTSRTEASEASSLTPDLAITDEASGAGGAGTLCVHEITREQWDGAIELQRRVKEARACLGVDEGGLGGDKTVKVFGHHEQGRVVIDHIEEFQSGKKPTHLCLEHGEHFGPCPKCVHQVGTQVLPLSEALESYFASDGYALTTGSFGIPNNMLERVASVAQYAFIAGRESAGVKP